MSLIASLAQQIVLMFLLMAIGFVLFRSGCISVDTSKDLGKVLLWVICPAIIIRSFWVDFSVRMAQDFALTFLLTVLLLALAMLISHLLCGRRGVAEFSAAFSNAGFIGIPLVQATVGERAVFYITSMVALLNVLQWTYGQYLLTGSAERISPKAVVTSPMLIAMIVGAGLFFLRVPQPEIASSLLSMLSAMNTPVAMIILGVYLGQSDVRSMLRLDLLRISAVRLLVIPLASVVMLAAIPCALEMKMALLLASAAPTGANVALFSQQCGRDYRYACCIVCVTTLLSFMTLPLVVQMASWLF